MNYSLEKFTSQYVKFNFYYIFILLTLFVFAFTYAIVEFPVFFFSDQHEHITKLLTNDTSFFYSAGAVGRLRPLSMTEFYFILTSGLPYDTIQYLMYVVQGCEFILFSVLVFFLLRTVTNFPTALFTLFAMFVFGMKQANLYTLFSHTVFQEQMVVLFLCASLLAYFSARKRNHLILFLLSVFCAVIATYYKEPTFAFIFTFGFLQLAFRYKKLPLLEKYYLFALLINGILFITIYFVFFYITNNYAAGRVQTPVHEIIWNSVTGRNTFILYGALVLLVRAFIVFKALVVEKDNTKFNDADAVLASALSYSVVIFVLNLNKNYYFMPTFVFVCVALGMYAYNAYVLFRKKLKNPLDCSVNSSLLNSSVYIVQYKISQLHNCKYQYLIIVLVTFVSVVVTKDLCKNYKRFSQYTFKTNKIKTSASLELVHNLKLANYEVITYLPAQEMYPYPHAYHQARWHIHTFNTPYEFKFSDKQNLPAITVFSEDSPESFYESFDKGNVAFFNPKILTTNLDKKALEDEYRSVSFFGQTRLYYHENYTNSIEPHLCRFIEDIYHADQDDFKKLFRNHYEDAKELQCSFLDKNNIDVEK